MNRQIIFGISALALVVVLAVGAFFGVRMFAQTDDINVLVESEAETEDVEVEDVVEPGSSPGRVIQSIAIENDGAPVAIQTTILPAPELPDEPSAAFGVLVSREDDKLIVGTGNIELEVDVEVDPATGKETATFLPSTDGPQLEVVLTADTIVYKDVTDLSLQPGQESGEREVVQAVRQVDSNDDVTGSLEIEVWGEKRGDRIVATLLVYGPLGGGAFE